MLIVISQVDRTEDEETRHKLGEIVLEPSDVGSNVSIEQKVDLLNGTAIEIVGGYDSYSSSVQVFIKEGELHIASLVARWDGGGLPYLAFCTRDGTFTELCFEKNAPAYEAAAFTGQYEILRKEFEGTDDSFIFQLRGDFVWDRDAFSRLIEAMKKVCEEHESVTSIEKWIASVYWRMAMFVKDHTLHPEFPRPYSSEYYEKAFLLIEELSTWLFVGDCPVIRNKETHFTI